MASVSRFPIKKLTGLITSANYERTIETVIIVAAYLVAEAFLTESDGYEHDHGFCASSLRRALTFQKARPS